MFIVCGYLNPRKFSYLSNARWFTRLAKVHLWVRPANIMFYFLVGFTVQYFKLGSYNLPVLLLNITGLAKGHGEACLEIPIIYSKPIRFRITCKILGLSDINSPSGCLFVCPLSLLAIQNKWIKISKYFDYFDFSLRASNVWVSIPQKARAITHMRLSMRE